MKPSEILWSSLFIPVKKAKSVIAAIQDIYKDAGYQRYNPFPGGTGTPPGLTRTIRLFVAPVEDEDTWTRVIGEPDRALLPALTKKLVVPIFYAWVDSHSSSLEIFPESADITPYLKPGKTPESLQEAIQMSPLETQTLPSQTADSLVQELATQHGVNPTQASKLIEKTTATMIGKLNRGEKSRDMDARAMGLLQGKQPAQLSWQSPQGQPLMLIMAHFSLPENWREPTFKNLVAAYPIACQLEQDEDTLLLPGDEDLLDKVPYTLDYTPLYYGLTTGT